MFFIIILIIFAFFGVSFWYYKKVFFFRDPLRIPPKGKNLILSPADGNVVYIKKFKNGEVISQKLEEEIEISEITKVPDFNKENGWIIGVYMKPTDVHFNYAPADGRIKEIVYTKSKMNLPMVDLWEYFNFVFLHRVVSLWSKKFHLQNERNTIFLESDNLKLIVVEIADKFINKIDCFVKKGRQVKRGQKMSFIKRGSQVDLIILKEKIDIKVQIGDQVYGGETILAMLGK
jgi:phosphatidylserine decarboxylase